MTWQYFSDFFVLFEWFGSNLKILFTFILSIITYFFSVLRFTWSYAFMTPPAPEFTYTLPANILAVFNKIPNWSVFTAIIGAVICFYIGIAILKLFLHT